MKNKALQKYLMLIKLSNEFDNKENDYKHDRKLGVSFVQYLYSFNYTQIFTNFSSEIDNVTLVETNDVHLTKHHFDSTVEFQEYINNNFREFKKKGGFTWYFYDESKTDKFWAITYRAAVFLFELKD